MMLKKLKGELIKNPLFKFFFLQWFKNKNKHKQTFECPICKYYGPFINLHLPAGRIIKDMECPNCKSAVRHRIQYLVFMDILKSVDTSKMKMLHVAPEPFFRKIFKQYFREYETADLNMKDVDYRVDLTKLPFKDNSYDFVFASHVLEHIKDDRTAVKEISRILRPEGIAMLPVPISANKTVEYPEPNPNEFNHVRAPGPDYFEIFKPYFKEIKIISSDLFPEKYQLFYFTDRSKFPNDASPYRTPMEGDRHPDMVPVCYA